MFQVPATTLVPLSLGLIPATECRRKWTDTSDKLQGDGALCLAPQGMASGGGEALRESFPPPPTVWRGARAVVPAAEWSAWGLLPGILETLRFRGLAREEEKCFESAKSYQRPWVGMRRGQSGASGVRRTWQTWTSATKGDGKVTWPSWPVDEKAG